MILPKTIRDQRRWTPGTRLIVEDTPEGVLLRSAPVFEPTTIDQVFGCLKYDGPAKTIEEMHDGIKAALRERFDRGRY